MRPVTPYRLSDDRRALAERHLRLLGLLHRLPALRRLAEAIGDPDEARQLAALGLCRAARNYSEAPGKGAFVAYATQCMLTELVGELARRQRQSRTPPRPLVRFGTDDSPPDATDPHLGPDAIVERAERATWFRAALAGLPERDRRILLARAEGTTLAAVAADLGFSRARVRQIEVAALARLRRLVPAGWGADFGVN